MTRSLVDQLKRLRVREAALSAPCEFCGAEAGQPCVTKRGTESLIEHVTRRRIGLEIVSAEDRDRRIRRP